ncbi:MAG: type II secretion system protein [Armatimonadota bacterium]
MGRPSTMRRGFTLIEMLLVVTVISILALIVIPRLQGAARRAREATLRANLQMLRTAIAQFESDTGTFPADLADLLIEKNSAAAPTTGAGGEPIPGGCFQGPYLTTSGGLHGTGMPQNPFAGASSAVSENWSYTPVGGRVLSAVTGISLEGVPYTHY